MDHGTRAVRPHVRAVDAWKDGWRRVLAAPVLIAGMVAAMALASEWQWALHGADGWAPTAIVGRKLSWIVGSEPPSFGGLATLAVRQPAGGAFMPAFGRPDDWGLGFAGAPVEAVLWIFLVGGAIDRLARDRRVGPFGFFGASGLALGRFIRLGIVLGAADWVLFRWLGPIRGAWNGNLGGPDGVTAPEAMTWLAVLAITCVGDYARVRLVVEDRRSALGGLAAAGRFIARRLVRSVLLLVLGLATIAAALVLWSWALPFMASQGPWASALWLWCYLAVLVVGRLALMAGEIAFFQGELAHAGYTARPTLRWPDSPAVEAITNLETEGRAGSGPALPL